MARLVAAGVLGGGVAGSVPAWGGGLCPLQLRIESGDWTWGWLCPPRQGWG